MLMADDFGPDPLGMRKYEDYLLDQEYKGYLRTLVAENRGILNLVPNNGNYAGNGVNDAWLKMEAYARAELGFTGVLQRNQAGESLIRGWLEAYFAKYTDTDPFNLKPQNRGDWAAFFHDIKSWGGILSDVRNNLIFSYDSVLSYLESHDPFDLMAAPFISFFGSAANVMTELVGAAGDVFGGFTDGFRHFYSGTQTAISQMWGGDFFGAVGSFFSGIGNAIGSFIHGIGDAFMHLFPVVLDLDGDGVELLTNAQAGDVRLFEADGEHYIQGGWVAPDDGLVAFDRNGNGAVDSMDEFVWTRIDPNARSDLEAMAVLDVNGDGVLDENDPDFARLLLWQDANLNGFSDPGEAIALMEAGIVSLSLSLENRVDQQIAGHDVLHLSTFERVDGTIGVLADVAFVVPSRVHSIFDDEPYGAYPLDHDCGLPAWKIDSLRADPHQDWALV